MASLVDDPRATKGMLLEQYNARAKQIGQPTRKQFETKEAARAALGKLSSFAGTTEAEAFGDTVDEATRRKIRAADTGEDANPRPPRVKVTSAVRRVDVAADGKETRAKQVRGSKKAKTEKDSAAPGQPRPGTDRARVLELADGTKTREQIGSKIGKDAKAVSTILVCMSRDYGTKYATDSEGRVKITAARS